MSTPEVRVVTVRPRTVLVVLGITVLVGIVLLLGYRALHVLTWIVIAALLASGLGPARAAALGAFLHGRAGAVGFTHGLVASDLLDHLPIAFDLLQE